MHHTDSEKVLQAEEKQSDAKGKQSDAKGKQSEGPKGPRANKTQKNRTSAMELSGRL